jgi:hypothetical protein
MAKNKYHLKVKGMTGKRKQFNKNGVNKTWLKTRHRVRQKLLG